MIHRVPSLEYLDERPITSEERRRAAAFAEGQQKAEKEEMAIIKAEREVKRET